jgi:hypothetical protein
MTLTATCHCGACSVTIPRKPRTVTDCNCSICRRYGVLWAYYKAGSVGVAAKRGAVESYAWGRRKLKFVRCRNCGCLLVWQRIKGDATHYMGVNARNLPLEVLETLRITKLDGAHKF